MTGPSSKVLIVGGGIGGMQAAIDLADAGFQVYIAEQESAIGGRMVQLDKTFPTNDCSMCTISPRLVQIGMNPNIKLLTNTSLLKLEGESPEFRATLKTHPRFVDLDKCKSCGECEAVCPVSIPKAFDMGLSNQKAVYKRYPQATPNAFAILKRGTAPCKNACPAHVHTQGYVALVREKKFKEAAALIRRDLPLPAICGRACAHPCEDICYRGERDAPVSIRSIKRYVADLDEEIGVDTLPTATAPIPGRRVAVVGAGPAGLSAAYFLALKGCQVTLFEAMPKAGGMMRYGVPAYRLPRNIIDAEVARILSLGIELKTGVRVGENITISSLFKDGYRKIFVASGLQQGRKLGIDGESAAGVRNGTDLLRRVSLGEQVQVGPRVAVIGGGNVAVDVARTCIRLGGTNVTMICLEKWGEMPAHPEEIEEATEEGVVFINEYGPKKIADKSSSLELTLKKCRSCFDEAGRFSPAYDENTVQTHAFNTIVTAVGQQSESGLLSAIGLASDADRLAVNPVTLETATLNVFAGGDLISGPKTIIEAVAMGRRAAESILASFEGRTLELEWPGLLPAASKDKEKVARNWARIRDTKRNPAERVKDFDEVAQVFSLEDAVREAERCLSCGDCSECLQCETTCVSGAINHQDREKIQTLDVGAVLLSPGFDQFDTRLVGEYGFGRYANVVSSLMVERMLSASGPTDGHIKRPSDRAVPKKIAWIQCVGSRDERTRKPYCSAVCCMFATKQALIIRDHFPEIETDIFYMDLRAYGKGFDTYVERAKHQFGVRYHRGMISKIHELPEDKGLEIRHVTESGTLQTECFDMVVLSSGLTPSASVKQLAEIAGITLNEFEFAEKQLSLPNRTARKGVYVAGVIEGPRDIPETVMGASSAAALIGADISALRWSGITEKQYPIERDVSKEIPRTGVFICRCGVNIARVVDVPTLTQYAKTLPNVVHAEENLYTCSADTQLHLAEKIAEYGLNRIVVASCTPRTHEALFQETLRDAGLNKYLFEMANIRDQCAWVHADNSPAANEKAKDLVRMAVARAGQLATLPARSISVTQSAMIIGGGPAGMVAALTLAAQGFNSVIVEKDTTLGGNLQHLTALEDGTDPREFLNKTLSEIDANPRIRVLKSSNIVESNGHIGRFLTTVRTPNGIQDVSHGIVIVAVGGSPHKPIGEYQYGYDARVITQLELEQRLDAKNDEVLPQQVVMIQCVGSREGEAPVCSRVCCSQAVKNAIRIKKRHPDTQVAILYRDIRTYGLREVLYREARQRGVLFVRYTPEDPPHVTVGDKLQVMTVELGLKSTLSFTPDLLVLSSGVRPALDATQLAGMLKLPLGQDGFFAEAHMKLRPLDVASEGFFLAGTAHGPKPLDEAITQAQGAAARAATILSRDTLILSSEVSSVDETRCVGCLTCVRSCPYNVPKIGRNRVAEIEPAACQGCGICAAACPRKAIVTGHSTDDQILAKVEALFDLRGETA